MMANTSVTPCTTGKSRWKIELIISWPIPGIAKICSMMTVVPTRKPMLMASTVTAGMTAFRSACRWYSRCGGTPLDRAVTTYSAPRTFSMLARRLRMTTGVSANATVRLGRNIECRCPVKPEPYPLTGKIRSEIANA